MQTYRTIAENLDRAFRRAPCRDGAPSPAFVAYLAIVYTEEEAGILQYMKGFPGFLTTLQIAGASGRSPEEVERVLGGIVKKNGITRMGNAWCIPPVTLLLNLASGLSNGSFDTKRAAELHRQFFVEDGYYRFYESSEKGTPSLRSIPVNRSIRPKEKVLKGEEAHELIMSLNHGDIVLAPCPCRQRQEDLGERECRDKNPVGSCIFLGISAVQHQEAGVGRRVSKEEAIAYFDTMHGMGLVGTTDNMMRDNMIICLCCGCCCSHLRGRTRWDNPVAVAPSSFVPDAGEGCVHCGICADKCWLDAIEVNRKEKGWHLDLSKCIGCGVCAEGCPKEALKMRRMERSQTFPSQDALYKALARENGRHYL